VFQFHSTWEIQNITPLFVTSLPQSKGLREVLHHEKVAPEIDAREVGELPPRWWL